MRAITLWEPWATLIALGYKTIETRRHARFRGLVGERIAIHAGQKWDEFARAKTLLYLGALRFNRALGRRHPWGEIVCTAFVDGFLQLESRYSRQALCECGPHLYGIALTDVRAVDPPVPCTGHQGIWHVPAELMDRLGLTKSPSHRVTE